ncbi:MAG: queuosine precursor transporter [Candidatus Ancillula sp.]|nr:queuosine precursor transporter [Candidatus Ancillula sp.]
MNNFSNKKANKIDGDLNSDYIVNPKNNRQKYFPVVAGLFCGFYIISNILAVKSITIPRTSNIIMLGPVQIFPFVLDAAFILFPFTYILDDVLSEIYGFKVARKVIFTGFALELIAVIFITIATFIPATPDAPVTDEMFATVLGYVPRIVCASLSGYLMGELINAWSLIAIRKHTGEKKLWVRLIGSTVFGEAADTITFCTVAFIGTISFGEFLNYTIVGYIIKILVEVVMLPITYKVVKFLKK